MHSRAGTQQDLVTKGNRGGFGGSAQFVNGYNFAGGAIHKTAVAANVGLEEVTSAVFGVQRDGGGPGISGGFILPYFFAGALIVCDDGCFVYAGIAANSEDDQIFHICAVFAYYGGTHQTAGNGAVVAALEGLLPDNCTGLGIDLIQGDTAAVIVNRGCCVDVALSVFPIEEGSCIDVVFQILSPNDLHGVDVDTLQQAAVVAHKEIVIGGGDAGFVAGIAAAPGIITFVFACNGFFRCHGEGTCGLVILGIQLDGVDQTVFAGVDQSVGFRVHQRAAVQTAPTQQARAVLMGEPYKCSLSQLQNKHAVRAKAEELGISFPNWL